MPKLTWDWSRQINTVCFCTLHLRDMRLRVPVHTSQHVTSSGTSCRARHRFCSLAHEGFSRISSCIAYACIAHRRTHRGTTNSLRQWAQEFQTSSDRAPAGLSHSDPARSTTMSELVRNLPADRSQEQRKAPRHLSVLSTHPCCCKCCKCCKSCKC